MLGFLDHECQGFVSAGIISLPYLLYSAAFLREQLCVSDGSCDEGTALCAQLFLTWEAAVADSLQAH